MREKNRLHEFDCIRMTIYAVSLLSLLCFLVGVGQVAQSLSLTRKVKPKDKRSQEEARR